MCIRDRTQAPLTSNLGSSPAKTIDNRLKCYKQLGELKDLKESGLLSEEEYAAEHEAIMGTLKKLSGIRSVDKD